MAYLAFSLSILFLVGATALYFSRTLWLHHLVDLRIPGRGYLYSRLPMTFSGDAEAGLSSDTFDLSGNIDEGDARAGLDGKSKGEIMRIMKRHRVPFDEARKLYIQSRFKASGIGPDGRPTDPKFVSFS